MEQCSIFRNSAVRLCRRLCVPTFTSAPPAPLARTLLPPSQLRFSRHKVFAGAGGTSFFKGIGDMLTNKSDNDNKKGVEFYPHIVKAGDPVLHEPAQDVPVGDISSDRIQTVIDDMIRAMRKAPGVGLAAPQIAVPLKIIVLEDTKEYISYAAKNEVEAQDRRPFDLLVVLNPKLKAKSKRKALFFEGCLSVDGYRALVERHLEVEVTGFDRYGHPIKINATG